MGCGVWLAVSTQSMVVKFGFTGDEFTIKQDRERKVTSIEDWDVWPTQTALN